MSDIQQQLDQAQLSLKLSNLKAININDANIAMFVAKVSPSNKNKRFQQVYELACNNDFKADLKNYVSNCIDGNEHINELRSIHTVQDNRFFYVESSSADFTQAVTTIENESIEKVSVESKLNTCNCYIIQLSFDNEQQNIYAFRYLSGEWSIKKSNGKFLSFEMFDNELVASVSYEPRFTIAPYIDFIQTGDDVFISDIGKFETAMNFHERLIEKKAESIKALTVSQTIKDEDAEKLTRVVGNDKHLMRQLSSVYSKGYYSNTNWLGKLKEKSELPEYSNWLVRFDANGKIEVDENKDYVKELLTLLQNKRVKTIIDEVVYDVDGELIALSAE